MSIIAEYFRKLQKQIIIWVLISKVRRSLYGNVVSDEHCLDCQTFSFIVKFSSV